MTDFENSVVASIDGLHALYAQPNERVAKKPLDHVNEVGRAFIAASPFLVLATGSRQGLDCSPKGDQPGFVHSRLLYRQVCGIDTSEHLVHVDGTAPP